MYNPAGKFQTFLNTVRNGIRESSGYDSAGQNVLERFQPHEIDVNQIVRVLPPATTQALQNASQQTNISEEAYPIINERAYADLTPIPINFTAVDPTRLILGRAPKRRLYLIVMNTAFGGGALPWYISFGGPVNADLSNAVPIAPSGGAYEFNSFVPQNEMWAVGNALGVTQGIVYYANE